MFRRVNIDVVCPECGDSTTWQVVYDHYDLPQSFRQSHRDTTMTCDHWRSVHELAWLKAISRRHKRSR